MKRTSNTSPPTTTPRIDLAQTSVGALDGVGLQIRTTLEAAGVHSVEDLLLVAPRRYLDLREASDWRLVRERIEDSLVSLDTQVADVRRAQHGRGPLTLIVREPTGTGLLRAVFFNVPPGLAQRARVGAWLRVVGVLRPSRDGGVELVHPKIMAHGGPHEIEAVHPSVGSIAPGTLKRIIDSALELAENGLDPVPLSVRNKAGLMARNEAFRLLHTPPSTLEPTALKALSAGRSPAHKRFAFEELFATQCALVRMRSHAARSRAFAYDKSTIPMIEERAGFSLTPSQREAIDVLQRNITIDAPMHRLLVGDVGSGKTAVAAAITRTVALQGGTVAWLTPTTLVAEQHAATLQRWIGADTGPVALLTSNTSRAAKSHALRALREGQIRVIVGTHALLEARSDLASVALVVIDEQHRFGVAQRLALVSMGDHAPHLLVLSATPIPRSLALARYGDLDLLPLRERPSGRTQVTTRIAEPTDQATIIRTIRRALEVTPSRVFVVVPRIEPDIAPGETQEASTVLAAIEPVQQWIESHFPEQSIVVHGRMNGEQQHEALRAFRRGTRPILIGTTVVEVGLDVPEANLMVVMGAEGLGLAQLHQLRGRVGRAGQKSGCLLVPSRTHVPRERLEALMQCNDGFQLAEMDLAQRGMGEFFGERQSGSDAILRFSDPMRDADLIQLAADLARDLLGDDPDLSQHPAWARTVSKVFERESAAVAEDAG